MRQLNIYQKTAVITVIATLFLILIGGLVRAAGAGLGCPDWPTCFGLWIPPMSTSELPPGFDPSEFNVIHTWLEYVNRLVGVCIGFLITLTFLLSFRYRRIDPSVTWCSGIAFVLVLLQGWLGGQVVRSGLSAGMITLHMILAMIILNMLLYATFRSMKEKFDIHINPVNRTILLRVAILLFILTLVQLVLGTQVREAVDLVKNAPDPLPREAWIDAIDGWVYLTHRSFSWLVIVAAGVLWQYSRRYEVPAMLSTAVVTITVLILLQVIIGAGMDRLSVPGLLQLLHLVGSALLLCAEFILILMLWFSSPAALRPD